MRSYFLAIIEGDAGTGYSVFFPDLPGLASAGDTVGEAALRAEQALDGHIAVMMNHDEPIPPSSDIESIPHDPEVHEVARILVGVDIPSTKTQRVNVTLPEDLLRRIDAATTNRSRFLAQAAERVLARDIT